MNKLLEMVTRNRPREIGVLELQEENGFYSVITAYQLSWDRSKVRGKLVWQYSVPQVPSDKQQAGPIEPLSADKVASTARLSRTKPDSNINDSQEKSSLSDDSSHYPIDDEADAAKDVKQVEWLDHSRYQENTMLAEDAPIPVVTVAGKWMTVSDAEAVIEQKIKQNHGRLVISNSDQKMPIQVVTNASLDEASSEKAVSETISDGTSPEIHAAALCNLEELLQHARLGVSHRDWHVHAKNQIRGVNRETALQIHR